MNGKCIDCGVQCSDAQSDLVPCSLFFIYESHFHQMDFRVRYTKDDSVEIYKAKLVARGFQQNEDIDFFQSSSPVVKPMTLRLIFSLAPTHGLGVHQVDINNAFLNS